MTRRHLMKPFDILRALMTPERRARNAEEAKRMASDVDRPRIGETVHVTFEDCCVSGAFTAAVTEVETDEDGELVAIRFSNGVSLSNDIKCRYERIVE